MYDLKRALSRRSAPSGAALADALQDVVELRQREEALTAELAELRDQNELLEFRLLELEGIVDKVSPALRCSASRRVGSPCPLRYDPLSRFSRTGRLCISQPRAAGAVRSPVSPSLALYVLLPRWLALAGTGWRPQADLAEENRARFPSTR